MGWLDKLKRGLKKTATVLSRTSLDADSLEESLILSDMGIDVADEIVDIVKREHPVSYEEMQSILRRVLISKLEPVATPLTLAKDSPMVILMVGVNGAGKTTTIGKLASKYAKEGKKIACIAGDTFRAGAVEQLQVWANKVGADFYSGHSGCDAAGLIFDALKSCVENHTDIVFIDTAGRLQNRTDLMDELKKIVRVIKKVSPSMPHETILVLDATVGQNAVSQVKTFKEMCDVTGLVMTKLDGTAKGGILVALASQFKLPVYAVGVGESEDDLNSFSASDYVTSLLGDE